MFYLYTIRKKSKKKNKKKNNKKNVYILRTSNSLLTISQSMMASNCKRIAGTLYWQSLNASLMTLNCKNAHRYLSELNNWCLTLLFNITILFQLHQLKILFYCTITFIDKCKWNYLISYVTIQWYNVICTPFIHSYLPARCE